MKCPKCKGKAETIDSRPHPTYNTIRRRRTCAVCSHKWTTYETECSQEIMKAICNSKVAEDFLRSCSIELIMAEFQRRLIQSDTIIKADHQRLTSMFEEQADSKPESVNEFVERTTTPVSEQSEINPNQKSTEQERRD